MSEFREKFHDAKTRSEVLNEKLKSLDNSINSRSVLILLGGIIFGYLPSLWSNTGLFLGALFIAVIFLILGFWNVFKKSSEMSPKISKK